MIRLHEQTGVISGLGPARPAGWRPWLGVAASLHAWTSTLLLALVLAGASQLAALPDDANQEIIVRASHNEFFLEEDRERVIYYGDAEQPAEFVQGSLRITGAQIAIERAEGLLKQVASTGAPARFQQQPALDQDLVHAQGRNIVFDNETETVLIAGEGELAQGGLRLTGAEISIEALDGGLTRASSHGAPARFQQQATADQPIIDAKGQDIVLDSLGQTVVITGEGELAQDGIILSGHVIEWNLAEQKGRALGRDSSERTQTIISPPND